VTFWIDEEPFEKLGSAMVQLTPGRHRITVRAVAGNQPGATLRVELHRPANSNVHFEVVHDD